MKKIIIVFIVFCSFNLFAAPHFKNYLTAGSSEYSEDALDSSKYFENTLVYEISKNFSILGSWRSDDYLFWNNRQYSLGGIFKITPVTTLDLRYNRGHDSLAVDSYGYSWELDQNIIKGGDVLLGYNLISFPYNDIQIGTLGYIQYFTERNWLILKYFGSMDTNWIRSGSYWLQYTQQVTQSWDVVLGGTTGKGYDTQSELLSGDMNAFYGSSCGVKYYYQDKNNISLLYEEMTKKDFYTRTQLSCSWQTEF